jgi:hypothetical protein
MPDEDGPLGEELLVLAEAQVAAGHFGVAVVIAQTVIEASVEFAFTILFFLNVPRSGETMRALLPDRTFMNRATRTLWNDLTYDDITEPRSEWKAYHEHIERRNKVAHGNVFFGWDPDEDVTEVQAKASLQAVRAMRDHIDRVVGQQVAELGGPKQDQWRALRAISPRPTE